MFFIDDYDGIESLHDALVYFQQHTISEGVSLIALCIALAVCLFTLLMTALQWFARNAPHTVRSWPFRLSMMLPTVTGLMTGQLYFTSLYGILAALAVLPFTLIVMVQPAWIMDRLTGKRLRDTRRRQYGKH